MGHTKIVTVDVVSPCQEFSVRGLTSAAVHSPYGSLANYFSCACTGRAIQLDYSWIAYQLDIETSLRLHRRLSNPRPVLDSSAQTTWCMLLDFLNLKTGSFGQFSRFLIFLSVFFYLASIF